MKNNLIHFICLKKSVLILLSILLCNCSVKNESKKVSSEAGMNGVKDTLCSNYPIQKKEYKEYHYDTIIVNKCRHYNLSKEFDIKASISRYRDTTEKQDSCVVKLLLTDKKTNEITDSIILSSHFYFDYFFMNCNNVRSYSTKKNANKKALDNYYGDLVVADFNFDKKDDLAVINDYGGNGGSFYSYFIQDDHHKFILNQYLTDSMTYFPSEMNKNNKTLKTYVHAGVCGLGEHIYQLNPTTNSWLETSQRIINVCEENQSEPAK